MSEAQKHKNKNAYYTKDFKKKMREIRVGEKNPMSGKNAFEGKTEEEMTQIRAKISEQMKRSRALSSSTLIECVETHEKFETITDVVRSHLASPRRVSQALKTGEEVNGFHYKRVPL
jgi:hypothetical protein